MLYEQGALATELPGQSPSAAPMSFTELKRRAYINEAAKAANQDPAFSERIREQRPGFGKAGVGTVMHSTDFVRRGTMLSNPIPKDDCTKR